MYLQANNAGCLVGREPNDIRKIGVKRDKHAAGVDCVLPDVLIGLPGQPYFNHTACVETLRPQLRRMRRRQVLVKQELHWLARMISSAASRAAYSRAALICSGLN